MLKYLGCHSSCSECTGPHDYDCIKCSLNHLQVLNNGKCGCPPGNFMALNLTCQSIFIIETLHNQSY